MGWYGPDQCEEHCCEPPTPCLKPVLTCRKTDSPQELHYTITGADEAWILESCRTSGGGNTVTQHMITLSGGAASGSFATSPDCTYCVSAVNACGTEFCCDSCDTPVCTISYELVENPAWDFRNNRYLDYVKVTWFYSNHTNPALRGVADLVVAATINGTSVFSSGFFGSGVIDVPLSTMAGGLVMTVTNECGKVSTCTVNVQCCHKPKQYRVSFDLSDLSYHCSGPNTFFGGTEEIWYDLTGLPSGTWLLDMYNAECRISTDRIPIGTITFTVHKVVVGSGAIGTVDRTETVTGTAYLQQSASTKAGLGIVVEGTRTDYTGAVAPYTWVLFREFKPLISSGFPGACGGVEQQYEIYFNYPVGVQSASFGVANCATSANFFSFLTSTLPGQLAEVEYIV